MVATIASISCTLMNLWIINKLGACRPAPPSSKYYYYAPLISLRSPYLQACEAGTCV